MPLWTQDKGSRREEAEIQVLRQCGWHAGQASVRVGSGPRSQAGPGPRGQVFTDSLWRVCIESDRVNSASRGTGRSYKGRDGVRHTRSKQTSRRETLRLGEPCG